MALQADNAQGGSTGMGQGGCHSTLRELGSPGHEILGLSRERKTTATPLQGCRVFHLFVCLFKMGRGVWGEELMRGLGKEFPLNLAMFCC